MSGFTPEEMMTDLLPAGRLGDDELGDRLLNDRFGASPTNPAGFAPGMWLFASLGVLGLVFSFLLWRSVRGPAAHGLETITTRG